MENSVLKKNRIKYIDIAKGLLIILLLYGHMKVIARMIGFDDFVLDSITRSMPLYSCFFMQTFFIITGLCSTFSVGFAEFLWKNIKGLIGPAIILSLINDYIANALLGEPSPIKPLINICQWFVCERSGPWFIFALFWSKILYWFINKIKKYFQFLTICILFFLGLWLNTVNELPEIQWHRHALLLLPFLYIGHLLKDEVDKYEGIMKKAALVAIPFILVERILEYVIDFPMPVVDFNLGVDFVNFPIHFANVFLGTSFIFYSSKKIQDNRILLFFGKGTLLIYLMNVSILMFVLKLLSPFYSQNIVFCPIYYLLSFALCLLIFYLLIWTIYNNKLLSWIVGKW